LRLLDALRALAQRDRDLLDARIAQIERMGMALAAIAHDRYLLALDQVQVRVAVVIYAHFFHPCYDGCQSLSLLLLWHLRLGGLTRQRKNTPLLKPLPVLTFTAVSHSMKNLHETAARPISVDSGAPIRPT